MGIFQTGQTVNTSIRSATGVLSGVGSATNAATRVGGTILSSGNLMSAIRSGSIPAAGEVIGDVMGAFAEFGGDEIENDWRVRLSIPSWMSFQNSPVLSPLKEAGGLIFPYTPIIYIRHSSNYSAVDTTHTNYRFQAYKNSDPGSISINAPMNVEDQSQALYWIGALHLLRSLTKMFSGNDPKAGNPPPVVFLNGYGNYVFKKVPVVVKDFSLDLPNECDYIQCEVVGSAAGEIEGIMDSVSELSSAVGNIGGAFGLNRLVKATNGITTVAGGIGQVAGLLGSLGIGGSVSGGVAYVPTKSSFKITLQPAYSRESARKFSLDRFVTGGYLSNPVGYI